MLVLGSRLLQSGACWGAREGQGSRTTAAAVALRRHRGKLAVGSGTPALACAWTRTAGTQSAVLFVWKSCIHANLAAAAPIIPVS